MTRVWIVCVANGGTSDFADVVRIVGVFSDEFAARNRASMVLRGYARVDEVILDDDGTNVTLVDRVAVRARRWDEGDADA